MNVKKEKVAAVVSAMGALLSIVIELVKYIKELGGDVGVDIYRLAQEDGKETLKAIAGIIVQGGQKARNIYRVFVDCTMSLADMITLGKYDWVNPDITAEHFPTTGTGKKQVTVELLHFNRHFKNGDEVLAEIDELGYRPAKIEELLVLGAVQPELQRQFPIAAFGNPWRLADGGRLFACLGRDGAGRDLVLRWIGSGFLGCWRFAVVRK